MARENLYFRIFNEIKKEFYIKCLFLGELTSYTIEKLFDTFKDDNCFDQCSDVNDRRFESTV